MTALLTVVDTDECSRAGCTEPATEEATAYGAPAYGDPDPYCSESCADDASHATEQARHARLRYEQGNDPRGAA